MSKFNRDILKHYGMTKQGRSNPSLSQAFVAVQPVAKDFDRLIQDIEWGIEAEIGDGLDNGDDLRLVSLKVKREWLDVVVGMTSGSYESPPEEIEDEAHVAVEVELKVQQTLSTQTLFRRFMSDTGSVADKRAYASLLTTVLKDSGAMKRVEKVVLGLAKGSDVDAENAEFWNKAFEDEIFDEIQYLDSKGGNLELTTSTLLPYAYKLKSVSVKFAGKGFLIDYVLVGKIDKGDYIGNIEADNDPNYGRYASFNNEVLGHYGIQNTEKTAGDWNDPSSRHHYASQEKTAGGTGWPLMKTVKVGPRRIKKVCYDSGAFYSDFLDGLDWKKVEFDKPEKNPFRSSGTLVWWRVYPIGEFGNRQSDYVYGYVSTEWVSGPKGIEVEGNVVVKH